MKLTTGILAVSMMTGGAWAQHPAAVNKPQSNLQAAQAKASGKPAAAPSTTASPVRRTAPVPVAHAPAPAKRVAAAPPRPVIAAKEPPKKKAVAVAAAAPVKKVEAPAPPKPEEKKWAMTGSRDPFISPVRDQSSGSGCSTGKKCLEIGQINVRGVVKSEGGFIAVVTNGMNKAYFLRENDPVFNGYVIRITGDTVVFQETVQDKLGKPETHEVIKRIVTPAV